MKKIVALLAVAASLAFAAPIFAQTGSTAVQATVAVPDSTPAPIAVGVTAPGTPVIVQPQAVQPYSFDAGTMMASFVNWLWIVFGGTLVSAAVLAVKKVMALMGIQASAAMNAALEDSLRNGMNDAAAKFQTDATGKFPIQVKNQIIAQAIEYAKAHRADTIKALGLDPNGGEVAQALRAKAESVIIDPLKATNPGLVANPDDASAQAVAKTG